MPYDPTSERGKARERQAYAEQTRQGEGLLPPRQWNGEAIVGPGGVPVRDSFIRNETRLDISKPLPEFAPDSEAIRERRHREPGWGMRLFGYVFAFICACGFLGVLAITIAWALDRYYSELFNK